MIWFIMGVVAGLIVILIYEPSAAALVTIVLGVVSLLVLAFGLLGGEGGNRDG